MRGTTRLLWLLAMVLLVAGMAFAHGGQESTTTPSAASSTTAPAQNVGKDVQVYTTPADYQKATGKTIPTYTGAPELATLVQSGKLPPVAKRLPDQPSVVVPLNEVGTYGGNLKTNITFMRDLMHRGLLQQDNAGTTVRNDLGMGYKYSSDYKTLTLYLRPGTKWSTGNPFTVDDILFWWNAEQNNKDLNPTGPTGPLKGAKFVKVDDYTLQIDFASPQPTWVDEMSQPYSLSQAHFYEPAFYLKKYHIDYNKNANDLAKQEGYSSWVQAYQYHTGVWEPQNRTDLPTLGPWYVTKITSTYTVASRNPYFWQVDTEGHQLPYIDTITAYQSQDPQTDMLQMISGQWDYMSGFSTLTMASYPVLKQDESQGKFRIVRQFGDFMTDMTITLNPLAPDLVMRQLIRDVRFRQALSLALDRNQMAQTIYFGLAEPRQEAPLPSVSFYKPEWSTYYIQHDPAQANKLLDEMGLKWDSNHDYRLRPDGKTLDILSLSGHGNKLATDFAAIVAQNWKAIGVKLTFKPDKATQDVFRNDKWEMMMTDNGGGSSQLANVGPTPAFSWWNAFGWQNWLDTNGKGSYVVKPPEEWIQVQQWTDQAAQLSPTDPEWKTLKQKIWDAKVKSLYDIGTVYKGPVLELVSTRLHNVAQNIWFGWSEGIQCIYQTQQWFLK